MGQPVAISKMQLDYIDRVIEEGSKWGERWELRFMVMEVDIERMRVWELNSLRTRVEQVY